MTSQFLVKPIRHCIRSSNPSNQVRKVMNVVDACVTKTSDVTHTKVEWIEQVLSHKSRRARRFGAESTKIEIEAKQLGKLE